MSKHLLCAVLAITIISPMLQAAAWRKCPKCKGKLKIKRSFQATCTECRGTGEYRRASSRDATCPECNAFGMKYHFSVVRCECTKRSECTLCMGTGERPRLRTRTCPRCRGEGKIREAYVVKSTCESCGGRKKLERYIFNICSKCNAKGYVRQTRRAVRSKRKRR